WGEVLTSRLDRVPAGVDAASFLLHDLHLLEPAWESDIVHRESTVLRIRDSSDVARARLAFPAAEILEIATANGATRISREQWELSADGVTVKFSGELPVEAISDDVLYLPQDAPNSYRHRRDHPEQNLMYRPGRWFHDRNLEITYRLSRTADVETQPSVVAGSLPATLERLRTGQSVKIGISGDSISTGLDASLTTGAAPFQPGYPELVVAQLRVLSDSDVTYVNRAVAGWSVANGLQDLDALLSAKPELIVIAYGMNDVGRKDPKWFREQNEAMIRHIREVLPQSEILLVCTMLGNREWIHTPREMFAEYRNVLMSCASSGTAIADLTEVWGRLLKSKEDLDLTGNGLNHPNDFGHRLYAQAILKLLAPAR
ncbi:MAG: SGNH/GDSL hydrolase family protein, partial [Planctomycetia bacterium]